MPIKQVDAEYIYAKLREVAEDMGFVNDVADEYLAEAAYVIEETEKNITKESEECS